MRMWESVWQADGEREQLTELQTTQECHLLMIIIIIIIIIYETQGFRVLSYWGQQGVLINSTHTKTLTLTCNLCVNLSNLYCCCCRRGLILAWRIRLNRCRCSVCVALEEIKMLSATDTWERGVWAFYTNEPRLGRKEWLRVTFGSTSSHYYHPLTSSLDGCVCPCMCVYLW